jgi:hypothetical protein
MWGSREGREWSSAYEKYRLIRAAVRFMCTENVHDNYSMQ